MVLSKGEYAFFLLSRCAAVVKRAVEEESEKVQEKNFGGFL